MTIPFSVASLALPGKVAIVTGGGTGIGRSMAVEFAKVGADIVVASRTVANLERVAAEVRALGRRTLAIQTDVSLKTDVDRMVAGTMEACGRVDILVNSAGLGSGIGDDGRGLGHRDPP
jgi:NAD(P)-dependent dehydrogenase (short-subunit alcohol dehydrogenase family)